MRVCDPAALLLGIPGWRRFVDQLEPIELIGPRGLVSQHRAQGNKDAAYRGPFVLRQPRCRLQYRASCGQRRDIAERPPLLDSDTQAVKDAIALTDGDFRSCRDPRGLPSRVCQLRVTGRTPQVSRMEGGRTWL
jgi:hypothetical protein